RSLTLNPARPTIADSGALRQRRSNRGHCWQGLGARSMHVRGLISGLVVPLLMWGAIAGVVSAQVQPPTKKGPFPPQKAPVPPQKTPVPPQKGPAPPMSKTPTPPAAAKGAKLPEPEDVSLETKDGFTLKATYYPG